MRVCSEQQVATREAFSIDFLWVQVNVGALVFFN